MRTVLKMFEQGQNEIKFIIIKVNWPNDKVIQACLSIGCKFRLTLQTL